MRDTTLFNLALGLTPPWTVADVEFDAGKKRLDIHLDFAEGGRFPCPGCARAGCKVHDTKVKHWRHLDFFQHQAFLHARTPRIVGPDCGVLRVHVPWARPDSGFTRLFEALVMLLVTDMPVTAAGDLVREYDTRLWRVILHDVEAAVDRMDLGQRSSASQSTKPRQNVAPMQSMSST